MPNNAVWLDEQTRAREVAQEEGAKYTRLGEVKEMLRLYDAPGWPEFEFLLTSEHDRCLESMIMGNPDETPALRERVKYIRHLLGRRGELEAEAARIGSALTEQGEEDE